LPSFGDFNAEPTARRCDVSRPTPHASDSAEKRPGRQRGRHANVAATWVDLRRCLIDRADSHRCVVECSQHGCHLGDGTYDEVRVVAQYGAPVSLILRHTHHGAERSTLRIAWDAEGATRIIPVDVIRTKVGSLTAQDQQVRCVSDFDEYTFNLQLPTALVGAVTQLINFVGGTV
jgi:hypothetical protein